MLSIIATYNLKSCTWIVLSHWVNAYMQYSGNQSKQDLKRVHNLVERLIGILRGYLYIANGIAGDILY